MFGLSLGHILILLIVILLFGAKRLPELASGIGSGLRAFKLAFEGRSESTSAASVPEKNKNV